MDDIVLVAVIQRASDLPRELSRYPLSQPPMADNIIQHLTTVHILKHHIVMMLMDDHLPHTADVWVVKQHGKGGLAQGSNFFRGILSSLLFGGRWILRGGWRSPGVDPRKDFDGQLLVRNGGILGLKGQVEVKPGSKRGERGPVQSNRRDDDKGDSEGRGKEQ